MSQGKGSVEHLTVVLPTGAWDSLWDASEAYLGIVGTVQDLGCLEETKVGK